MSNPSFDSVELESEGDQDVLTDQSRSEIDSTIANKYHQKRAAVSKGNYSATVFDVYVTENHNLHLVTVGIEDSTAIEIPLPVTKDADRIIDSDVDTVSSPIDPNMFARREENQYKNTIEFLQYIHEVFEASRFADIEGKSLPITFDGEDSTVTIDGINISFDMVELIEEDKQISPTYIDPLIHIVNSYFGNGVRGIKTQIKEYSEDTEHEDTFVVTTEITPNTNLEWVFDVSELTIDPEKDPTVRLVETLGSGNPQYVTGGDVVVIHESDYDNELESHQVLSKSTSGNWLLLLPDDHSEWWQKRYPRYLGEKGKLFDEFAQLAFRTGGLAVFIGIIFGLASRSSIQPESESGDLSYELMIAISNTSFMISAVGGIILVTAIVTILTKRYFHNPPEWIARRLYSDDYFIN